MKFLISSEKFKKVVNFVTHLCGSNLTLPILNNILLELKKGVLLISSTNLEIGLSIQLPVKSERDGKVTVPGKIFSDFISYLPTGEIRIEEKGLTINVKTKGFQAKILGQDPKEFPILPQIKEKLFTEIESKILIEGLSKVSHIASPSDTRVEISGILIKAEKKSISLVGTDSIRLGEKKISLPSEVGKKSIIIPQRTANELIYIFSDLDGKIKMTIEPSQVGFEFAPKDPSDPKIVLVSRLIEGQYPDYEGIIPQKINTQAILDKNEFQKKIKIASLFSSRIQDVKLRFEPSKSLTITSASAEVGEVNSKLEGEIEGKPIEIVFNWRYLLDGLSAIDSSEVSFGLNDTAMPAVLKPIGDKSYLYVLMPKTI
ncbi:MAG: DNA polymerase III subunit beta [Patescibacteria group bacterium]